MSASVEGTDPRSDTLKLAVSLLIFTIALVAFYYFNEQSTLLRVVGLFVAGGISIALFIQTTVGRDVLDFLKDSRTEVRKVVWPSRDETTRTTLLIVAVVLIVATFLWLLDMFLGWVVKSLTG